MEVQAQMQQEELAGLFARSLNFSNYAPAVQTAQQEEPAQHQPPLSQPVTYITQHYNHSAHVRPKAASEPSTSYSLTNNHFPRSDLESLLRRSDIDPSFLYPSQINLFQNADSDQRLRLLELWRIAPLKYGNHEMALYSGGPWPDTNLQQEEEMAKLRYDRLMDERRQDARQEQQQDSSSMEQNVPAASHWPPPARARAASILNARDVQPSAEPYVISGYESLAQRDYIQQASSQEPTRYNQSTDPVYQAGTGLWTPPTQGGYQSMEDQYGAFEQLRGFGGTSGGMHYVGIHGPMDEDMVM
ncbi:hypothetical protein B0A49_01635 [Cryomyces minteri]|uniref:Uncharacterized protein n=1 Tax=Cryomyces minteri TaxID=331657 RepID=A0A4U0XML2_9PEZI|nr:hypothetical protein B0A49_01635 [Cryomyces minteri]